MFYINMSVQFIYVHGPGPFFERDFQTKYTPHSYVFTSMQTCFGWVTNTVKYLGLMFYMNMSVWYIYVHGHGPFLERDLQTKYTLPPIP